MNTARRAEPQKKPGPVSERLKNFNYFSKNTPYGTVTSIYLERREPARNRQRFYTIAVTRTLWRR